MFEETSTGFRITFDYSESTPMNELARGYFNLVSDIWAVLTQPPLTKAKIDRFRMALKLTKLASKYLDDMVLCTGVGAFFAACTVGSAMMETVLLLACTRDRDQVTTCEAWKRFAKKEKRRGKLFPDLILWIDLGTLIEIGMELEWFQGSSDSTRDLFTSYPEGSEYIALHPTTLPPPSQAVRIIHDARNQIHAGRCIREGIDVEEMAGELHAGLVYVSLMGVLSFYKGPTASFLDLDVPEPLRTALLASRREASALQS